MKEGSFEGQMSGLDFTHDEDLRIAELPQNFTPKELPDRIDFSTMPQHILKSDVIESLIGQNEDLMSRLTMALRRGALLDEKVTDARTESSRYKSKYNNLMDQVLVLREQARVLTERLRTGESMSQKEGRNLQELKEQLKIVEIRYAELYTVAQEKQTQFETHNLNLNRRLSRFQKYRQNMRRAIALFRQELSAINAKRNQFESITHGLKNHLEESTTYISQQAKDHKVQLSHLTDSYEKQIADLQGENQMLEIQNSTMGERVKEVDRLFNEKVKLENELIIAQRREQEYQLETATEISDLQKSLARFRSDAKELAIDLDARMRECAEKTELLEKSEVEKKAFNDQVETLQLLWREQQSQIDKLTNQKDSLQRLNKELSVSVNDYRREVRELKEALEAEAQKTVASKKKHDESLKILKKSNSDVMPADDSMTPDLMSKIDKALTNLHVGR